MVQAFIGMMDDDSQNAVPEANAYEFQSGGAFDMKLQDLVDSVENSNSEVDEKSIQKSRKQEKAALDKKELASTTAGKAADETTLSDAKTECAEKSMSYDEKQQLRTEEIEAIQQAIKILSGEGAQGGV